IGERGGHEIVEVGGFILKFNEICGGGGLISVFGNNLGLGGLRGCWIIIGLNDCRVGSGGVGVGKIIGMLWVLFLSMFKFGFCMGILSENSGCLVIEWMLVNKLGWIRFG
ncbi:hypothetical protein, partial [Bacillus thuringiensis]|uniref:hypothetical protein n=1 Tax=Bacillus thuringiensis TaxID=1428 RepID=UPI001642D7F1